MLSSFETTYFHHVHAFVWSAMLTLNVKVPLIHYASSNRIISYFFFLKISIVIKLLNSTTLKFLFASILLTLNL